MHDLFLASKKFQYKMRYDAPDSIFPENISDLHNFSDSCNLLITKNDWDAFGQKIKFHYKKYSELEFDFPEFEELAVKNIVISECEVCSNRDKYSIKLLLNGVVLTEKHRN